MKRSKDKPLNFRETTPPHSVYTTLETIVEEVHEEKLLLLGTVASIVKELSVLSNARALTIDNSNIYFKVWL